MRRRCWPLSQLRPSFQTLNPHLSRGTIAVVLILALAAALISADPAQAQPAVPLVSLVQYQTGSRFGDGPIVITLSRTGDISQGLERVKVYFEGAGGEDGTYTVAFPAGARTVDLHHQLHNSQDSYNRLEITVDPRPKVYKASTSQFGWIHVPINDENPSGWPNLPDRPFLGITANQSSVTEGSAVTFSVTRDFDLAEELSVNVSVNDPDGVLTGDSWSGDPAQDPNLATLLDCDIPNTSLYPNEAEAEEQHFARFLALRELCSYMTTVTFEPGEDSKSFTVKTRNDQRDLPYDGKLSAAVLGAFDYRTSLFFVGGNAKADVTVVDSDVAPSLNVTVDRSAIKEVFGELTFNVSQAGDIAGYDVFFTLRLEHDRTWDDPLETGWQQVPDSSPPRWFKEFEVGFANVTDEFSETIRITDNLMAENDWTYTASLSLQSVSLIGSDGQPVDIPEGEESYYLKVSPPVTANVVDNSKNKPTVAMSTDQESVDEGGEGTFTVSRSGDFDSQLRVRVSTEEPYHPERNHGYNPSLVYHDLVFRVGERDISLTVTATNDAIYESYDVLQGEVDSYASFDYHRGSKRPFIWITDDDLMRVSMASDVTSIVEGDAVTFTLTRFNNIQNEAIVGLSIQDPGNFLRGNHWEHALGIPSSIYFPQNVDNASFTLQTKDDWRDIPDNAITVSITPEPASYEIIGAASIDVAVADNDVAPQLSLAYQTATVEEGQPLTLVLRRIGDDRNPVEFYFDAGPRDSQERYAVTLDPGESEGHLVFDTIDDDYNGPDIHYDSTNYHYDVPPGIQSEYWTMAGPATSTATVTDNDLPTIRLESLTPFIQEGQQVRFRILRDGYTDPSLAIQYRYSQEGSAVSDAVIAAGDRVAWFNTGQDSITPTVFSRARDGDDPDAVLTIELIESPDYNIDPNGSSASVLVLDRDPAPVASIEDVAVAEDVTGGSVDFTVTLSGLPSLRTITLDYATQDGTATEMSDYTYTSGTLTFGPGDTGGVISVPLLDDRFAETLEETFTLTLSHPYFLKLRDGQSSLTATATITDDEPVVSLAAVNAVVIEGTPVEFTLARTGDTTQALTVSLALVVEEQGNTTATQPTVTFLAGDAEAAYTIPVADDGFRNGTRVYTAVVVDPAVINGPGMYAPRIYAPASSVPVSVHVRDNDLPQVSLSRKDLVIAEGRTATFTLERPWGYSGPNADPLTVNISVTATGNFLSAPAPASVTFEATDLTVSLELETVNDSVAEDNGTITVEILDGPGYTPGFPLRPGHNRPGR